MIRRSILVLSVLLLSLVAATGVVTAANDVETYSDDALGLSFVAPRGLNFIQATRTDYEAQLNTNRQLAIRAGLARGQKVLDAGCGIGGSAIWLAETYGAQVFGVTVSADQVRRATANAAGRGVSHLVTFSQQDYTTLDVEAASFDVVWALESVSCALVKREFFT